MPAEGVVVRQGNDELRRAFTLFDATGQGAVCIEEVPLLLKAVGVSATQEEIMTHIETTFGSSLSAVSLGELRVLAEALRVAPDSEEEAGYVFDLLVSQGARQTLDAAPTAPFLVRSDIQELLRTGTPYVRASDPLSSVERLFKCLDVDGDGVVSRADWIAYLTLHSKVTSSP